MPEEQKKLLGELIDKIDSSSFFLASREAGFAEKKARLAVTADMDDRYEACMAIAGDYSTYKIDSALFYLDRAGEIARMQNDRSKSLRTDLDIAKVLIRSGCFAEAYMILESMDTVRMDAPSLQRYNQQMKDLYHGLYIALDPDSRFRREFVRKFEYYRDLLLDDISNDAIQRELERKYARAGQFEEALSINDQRMKKMPDGLEMQRALVLYDRYTLYYYYMGCPQGEHIEYLLESAISDVYSVNQNIASLRYLESWLMSIGYIPEAKKVSDYYYSTMRRFGSRSRMLDGVELSMSINEEYSRLLAMQKRSTQLSLWAIVLLLIVLVCIMWQIVISRRKVMLLNSELDRSGRVSKGYVLGFFQLYSSYIARMLAFRSKINTSIRKGNVDYVRNMSDPTAEFINEELKSMYYNFDAAFLDIFPDYVDRFNSLLRPECRISLRPNELLNMELRIFAVIKLGITDSAKISELLHCSIKTVYNKRSEINNKLFVSKSVFLEELARI